MDKLVTRILELASREPEGVGDFIDLGEPTTSHSGRLTPNTGSYSKTGTYEDTNGYSKVVNLKGLAAASSGTDYSERQRQPCCS